ncbi:MAG: L,D-transpeptidase [Firmicutes bacterium]|nr:L,D-transpeptidase [Bacillota bacterium]
MRRVFPFFLVIVVLLLGAVGGRATEVRFSVVVNLPAFRLYLCRDGHPWRDYPVAIGKPETPTPIGVFKIVNKVREPTWYPPGKKPVPPGPENPLGRWWFGLSLPGYGLHGCRDETVMGTAVSHGCLRLRNADLDELARFIGVGTEVEILYRLFAWREDPEDGRRWLWVGEDVYGHCPSLFEGAAAFLAAALPGDWDPEEARPFWGGELTPGWHEIPRPVTVFLRDEYVGRASLWGEEVWLGKNAAASIVATAGLTDFAGGEKVRLEELVRRFGQDIDWRYNPKNRELAVFPIRLRFDGRFYYGVTRFVEGQPTISKAFLAAIGCPTEGEITAAEVPLAAIAQPWRAAWDPAAWEVVLLGPPATGTADAPLSSSVS